MGVQRGKPTLAAPPRPRRRRPPAGNTTAPGSSSAGRIPPPPPPPPPPRRRPAVTLAPDLGPKAPSPVENLRTPPRRQPRPTPAPAPRRQPKITLAPNLSPKAPTPVQALVQPAQRHVKRQLQQALGKTERNIVLPTGGGEAALGRALAHFGIDSQAKVDALPPAARRTVQQAIDGDKRAMARVQRGHHISLAKNYSQVHLPKGYRTTPSGGTVWGPDGLPLSDADAKALLERNTIRPKVREMTDAQLVKLGAAIDANTPRPVATQYVKPPPKPSIFGPGGLQGLIEGTALTPDNPQVFQNALEISRQANALLEADKSLKKTLLGRAAADTIELGTNLIPAAADTVSGAVSAARGNPKPLLSEAKGFTYPFVHPKKSFHQHPVGTLAAWSGLIAGGEGLAEGGILGRGVARAASRERAPLEVPTPNQEVTYTNPHTGAPIKLEVKGAPIKVERSYARPVLKPFQKAREAQVRRGGPRRGGRNPNVATEAQTRSILYGGSPLSHRLAKGKLNVVAGAVRPGLVDMFGGDWEAMRRFAASNDVGKAHKLITKVRRQYGKGSENVMPLIFQHIVRRPDTLGEDLRKELVRLDEAAQGNEPGMRPLTTKIALQGKKLEANLKQQEAIKLLLANRKLLDDPKLAFDSTDEIAHMTNARATELHGLGALSDEGRAALFPAAQAHHGAVTSVQAARSFANAAEQASIYREDLTHMIANGAPAHEIEITQKNLRDAEFEMRTWGPYHPHAVDAFQSAKAAENTARQDFKKAEAAHARAVKRRSEIVGAQRVQRGVRGARQAAAKGETGFGRVSRASKGELAKKAAIEAEIKRAAVQRRLAHGNFREARGRRLARRIEMERRTIKGLRTAGGLPFESTMLRQLIDHESGGRPVGFLSHYLPEDWGSNVFSRLGDRPGLPSYTRTGESFASGAHRNDAEALLHQVYDTVNRVTAHKRINALVDRFGVGRLPNAEQADAAARHITTPDGRNYVPYNIGPEAVIQKLADLHDDPLTGRPAQSPRADPISLRDLTGNPHLPFGETNREPPKFTLLHPDVAQRMVEHDKLAGRPDTVLSRYTSAWRNAALYASPRWIFGTPQENAIRLIFKGINPLALLGKGRAAKAGRLLAEKYQEIANDESLPQLARDGAEAHLARYSAGMHYASQMVNTIHTEDLAWAAENPVTGKAINAWHAWTDKALKPGMSKMEHNAVRAIHGKNALKEATSFSQRILGINDEVGNLLRDYAHHSSVDPNRAAAVAQQVMEAAGNWTHLTPKMRHAVQTWTPFGLWWANSLKFIFRTLPRDHPMATGILAALSMSDLKRHPEREKQSIGKPYLGGTFHVNVPGLGGMSFDPTYYSPWGTLVDPGKTAADMVAPQLTSQLLTARGINSLTGSPLTMKRPGESERTMTPPELVANLFNTTAEGLIPGLRQGRQLLEMGAKPYPTANIVSDLLAKAHLVAPTTAPGTQRGLPETAAKILLPFKFFWDPRATKSAPLVKPYVGKGSGPVSSQVLGLTAAQQRQLQQAQGAARGGGLTPAQQRQLQQALSRRP